MNQPIDLQLAKRRCRRKRNRPAEAWRQAFSLVEVLLVLAIVMILAGLGVAVYQRAMTSARISKAIGDIRALEGDILHFYVSTRRWPDSLADVGRADFLDPWGSPYQYLELESTRSRGDARKDRFLVPINSDFDLFSRGPDRDSVPPLTAPKSHDDIIRANDGSYVGVASQY